MLITILLFYINTNKLLFSIIVLNGVTSKYLIDNFNEKDILSLIVSKYELTNF